MAERKRTTDRHQLDDAAARALWALRHAPIEHIGLLYEQDGTIRATPTRSQHNESKTRGTFAVPAGSLRAIFHNHPPRRSRRGDLSASRRDRQRSEFSRDDIIQAQKLGVPSYIQAGNELLRYTPGGPLTGEPVLAEIPIDVIVRDLMVRLLNRDPNDPRGLYRESPNFPGLLAN